MDYRFQKIYRYVIKQITLYNFFFRTWNCRYYSKWETPLVLQKYFIQNKINKKKKQSIDNTKKNKDSNRIRQVFILLTWLFNSFISTSRLPSYMYTVYIMYIQRLKPYFRLFGSVTHNGFQGGLPIKCIKQSQKNYISS